MGDQETKETEDEVDRRAFMKAVLDDVRALERMLEEQLFETGIRRIGVEQELFLIDGSMRPNPVAMDILGAVNDARVTTELARFNLEFNGTPLEFGKSCLRQMEAELNEVLDLVRTAARNCNADILMTGILPTLRKPDLGLHNMTPNPRYESLNRALTRQRDGAFHIFIKGVDELQTQHDNVMLESCNTSFQVHFQVAPDEFADLYNLAQVVTGPVLAAAVNSPMFLGHRLWHETRVALFQLSVDERSSTHQTRGVPPRVTFGSGWVRKSVLEIFREQIARFRVLLAANLEEDSLKALDEGRIPQLKALRVHNGTTYRWNRACYGFDTDIAHLRIENRVLPAGPTILDEMANAAFYFGLMSAASDEYGDVTKVFEFDDARSNFFEAARNGLEARLTWVGGKAYQADELIVKELLPMARTGLSKSGIDGEDIDRYLGVLEARVESRQTGAKWVFDSLARMGANATRDIRERSIATAMLELQKTGAPVHTWDHGELRQDDAMQRQGYRTVGQFMSTDLFTVHPEDLVDLAASVMEWEHIRHVPVEDEQGHLVGIVTHRTILKLMARGVKDGEQLRVGDIMRRLPIHTVTSETLTLDALRMMRANKIGCLPVLDEGKLVGIITESDLIEVSHALLEKYLEEAAGRM